MWDLAKGFLNMLFLMMLIVSLFPLLIRVGVAQFDNIEEFEANVIFYDEILGFHTLFDESEEWDMPLGLISFRAYASLGKCFIRLPAVIKTKYDTTLEPNEINEVEMAIEPFDGEGYEFEFIFGFKADLTYENEFFEVDLGSIGWGLNWEADFAGPLQGNCVRTSAASIDLYSIGVSRILDVTFGLDFAWDITGYDVTGSHWLDDPCAEMLEEDVAGVELDSSTYKTQFSIHDNCTTGGDSYVDFGVQDMQYNIQFDIVATPVISFSMGAASTSFNIPETGISIPFNWFPSAIALDASQSDDLDYQMSRSISSGGDSGNPGPGYYNQPILDLGPLGAVAMTPDGECPSVDVPLRIISYTPGWEINDDLTILGVYYPNGSLMVTIDVNQSNFDDGYVSVALDCPSVDNQTYQPINFLLSAIFEHPLPNVPIPIPDHNKTVTMILAYTKADLTVKGFKIRQYSHDPFTYQPYGFPLGKTCKLVWLEITPGIENVGTVSSAPCNVKLWVTEDYPTGVTIENINITLIPAATLAGEQPIPNILPRQTYHPKFHWVVTDYWENKNATFILYVDYENTAPENIERENNIGYTTFSIENTSSGMIWVFDLTNRGFSQLNSLHESLSALDVAEKAVEALSNPETYNEPFEFLNTLKSIVESEHNVTGELQGKVTNATLETYNSAVEELDTAIFDSMLDGNYTQEEILRVIHLQLKVCSIVDKMCSGQIFGFALDNDTHQPLKGVKIRLNSGLTNEMSSFTDEYGAFNFTNLYPTLYNLSGSKWGYQDVSQQGNVTVEGSLNLTLWLTSLTGALEVNVTESSTGLPVNGVIISLNNSFSEGFEEGDLAGWNYTYSTNGVQSGALQAGTWNSSVISGVDALSELYTARLWADSVASYAPWKLDAAISQAVWINDNAVLSAIVKFNTIQGMGGVGHSYFSISVIDGLNLSKSISYGFSSTGDVGNIKYTVNPDDTVHFEGNVSQDYFNKYGENLSNNVIIRFLASADFAEGGTGRRTTDVLIDDIKFSNPPLQMGVTTNGCITFDKLLPGNYLVSTSKDYFIRNSTSVTIQSRNTTSLQIPLTHELHDIEIVNLVTEKTIISNNTMTPVNVTVQNSGDFIATFYVSLYYGNHCIGVKSKQSLANGNETTIFFSWNTSGAVKGNHTLNAYVSKVPGEIDVGDNTYVDSWIFISIPGDVNGDRDVDIFDIVTLASRYGATSEDPQYNPNYDLDGDGDIDIFDIVAAVGHYGESW